MADIIKGLYEVQELLKKHVQGPKYFGFQKFLVEGEF